MVERCIRCEKDIEEISLLCEECAEERFRNNLFWIIISPVVGSPVVDRYKQDSEPTLTIGERPGEPIVYQEGLKTIEEVKQLDEKFKEEKANESLNRMNTILAELGVVRELDFENYIFSREDVEIFAEIFYTLEDIDPNIDDEERVPDLYLRMGNIFFYSLKKTDSSAFPLGLRKKLVDDFKDEAKKYYDKSIEYTDKDYISRYNLGKLFFEMGNYSEAREYFEEALDIKKGVYEIQVDLIKTLQRLDELDEVDDHLEKMVEEYPEEADVWHLYGEQARLRDRWGGALQFYDQALSKDGEHLVSLLSKGKILLENNNYKKANKSFDEYIRLDENNPEVWLQKGKALDSLNKWGGALQCINECIAFDSQRKEAWVLKGEILEDKKYYDEAIESYENALKLDPDSEKVKRAIEECKRFQ